MPLINKNNKAQKPKMGQECDYLVLDCANLLTKVGQLQRQLYPGIRSALELLNQALAIPGSIALFLGRVQGKKSPICGTAPPSLGREAVHHQVEIIAQRLGVHHRLVDRLTRLSVKDPLQASWHAHALHTCRHDFVAILSALEKAHISSRK